MQRAVREAITPDDLTRVLRSLRDVALDGEASTADRIAAARVLFERTVGKPKKPEQTVQLDFDPEQLTGDAAVLGKFTAAVLAAVLRGEVDWGAAVELRRIVELQVAEDVAELRQLVGEIAPRSRPDQSPW